MKKKHVLVVGAGISGAVLAERFAHLGYHVTVLEKRNHIGGNCYDYFDEHGLHVAKYGAHLFHTNFADVWTYVSRFSKWRQYKHKVLSKVNGKLVPIPVNITTVNTLLGLDIKSEKEMKKWLQEVQVKCDSPKNSEQAALARVGPVLYELLFKNYTKKQWNKYPHELDASVLNRIPVRTTFEDGYFSDTYQGQPTEGFTPLFENMFSHSNIEVVLNQDYFDIKDEFKNVYKVFYTGPIDQFFNYRYNFEHRLEYRSIRFVSETHHKLYYQPNSVINYPNDFEFTRIVEYKHMYGQKHPMTTIVKEFTTDQGEPYYPVPNPRNQAIYEKYRELTHKFTNIHFVGRLANYKYFNMDEAFKNALDLFHHLS